MRIPARFYSIFPEFLNKVSPILLKFVFFESVVDFYLWKQKQSHENCRLIFVKILAKYFKIQIFFQKQHEISFFLVHFD